jgi:hypothetical protein
MAVAIALAGVDNVSLSDSQWFFVFCRQSDRSSYPYQNTAIVFLEMVKAITLADAKVVCSSLDYSSIARTLVARTS